ncbi:hypothetical protein AB0O52_06115 [Arthrobacter sp. NPDC080073]|uniref:hypothetical protein n=1 Tax=Arthrobacter sp. NPDC080073 TaxID=3155919 RepID=UPI0034132343
MLVLKWLQPVLRQYWRLRSGLVGLPNPAEDLGQQTLIRRLEADDSYWWILVGGIHVPGFGPHDKQQQGQAGPGT